VQDMDTGYLAFCGGIFQTNVHNGLVHSKENFVSCVVVGIFSYYVNA